MDGPRPPAAPRVTSFTRFSNKPVTIHTAPCEAQGACEPQCVEELFKDGGRAAPLYCYSKKEAREAEMMLPTPPQRLVIPLTGNKRSKESCLLKYVLGDDEAFVDTFDPGYLHKRDHANTVSSCLPLGEVTKAAQDGSRARSLLSTSSDVISFFADPNHDTNVKFVHLAPVTARYAPYDLLVTPVNQPNEEYYIFSHTGVVHVIPDKPAEVMLLSQWVRQASMYSVLRKVRFFKYYLIRKALTRWRRNVKRLLYKMTRAKLARHLLVSKSVFAPVLSVVHELAYQLQMAEGIALLSRKESISGTELDVALGNFKAAQMAKKENVANEIANTLQQIQSTLSECCEGIKTRADVPDAASMEVIKQYVKCQMEEKGPASAVTIDLPKPIDTRHTKEISTKHNVQISSLSNGMRLSIQGSYYSCLSAKADVEELQAIPAVPVVRTRLKVRSMAQEKINTLSRMSYMKRCMEDAERIDSFLRLVHYIVAECLFKFILTQMEVINQAVTGTTEPLILLHVKMIYEEEETTFAPPQSLMQASLLDTIKGLCDLANKEAKHFYSPLLSQYRVTRSTMHFDCFNDFRVQASLDTMRQTIDTGYTHAAHFISKYACIRSGYYFLTSGWESTEKEWSSDAARPSSFREIFNRLAQILKDLSGLYSKSFGAVHVNMFVTKDDIMPKLLEREKTVEDMIIRLWRLRMSSLLKDVAAAKRSVSETSTKLAVFSALARSLREVDAEMNNFITRQEEAELLFEMIDKRGYPLTIEDRSQRDALVSSPTVIETLQTVVSSTREFKQSKIRTIMAEIKDQMDTVVNELLVIEDKLSETILTSSSTAPDVALEHLENLDKQVTIKEKQIEELMMYQEGVGCGQVTTNTATRMLLESRKMTWNVLQNWKETHQHFYNLPINEVDGDEFEKQVIAFNENAEKMHAEQGLNITHHILNIAQDAMKHLPLIMCLTNKQMKPEHWKPLFDAIQHTYSSSTGYSIASLFAWNITHYTQLVETQSRLATGQAGVENLITELEEEWGSTCMQASMIRSVPVISNGDQVMNKLEDSLVQATNLMNSEFIQNLHQVVSSWIDRLSKATDNLQMWLSLQESRLGLQTAASTPVVDVKELIPVDVVLKELSTKQLESKPALKVLTDSKVRTRLKEASSMLGIARDGLDQFLNSKRKANARLQVLSNADLLQLLSSEPDYSKVFPFVKVINKTDKYFVSAESLDGETLTFCTPVNIGTGSAVDLLQSAMTAAVKESCNKAQYSRGNRRSAWLFSFIAQAVQVADEISWTQLVEQGITDGNLEACEVEHHDNLVITQRAAVNDSHTLSQKLSLASTVTLAMHGAEILTRLVQEAPTSLHDFSWQKCFRRYQEGLQHKVHHAMFWDTYGNEYYGCRTRLVLTPQLEKTTLLLACNFRANSFSCIYGASGVGKTESVLDYAQAIGKHVVVVTCMQEIASQQLAKTMLGVAQAGGWMLLDNLHGLQSSVLSVVVQLAVKLGSTIAAGKPNITYMGVKTSLTHGFTCLMTVNEDYLPNLPQSVKESVRPIALTVPDFVMVAIALLFACGFPNAEELGTTLGSLTKMCASTSGLDGVFSLQWMNSVIQKVSAMRKQSALPDTILMEQCIKTKICDAIPAADQRHFVVLLGRFFETGELVGEQVSISGIMEALGYVEHGNGMSCVSSLVDALHGASNVLICGGAMTGKTAAVKCGAHAVGAELRWLTPCAYTSGQLYGAYDAQHGWLPGIVPAVVQSSTVPTIIVFDSPMGPWFDTTSCLLNRDRSMRLADNDVMKIPPDVQLLLETDSLSSLTPAVVSKLVLVYLGEEQLDCKLVVIKYFKSVMYTGWVDPSRCEAALLKWVGTYYVSCSATTAMFRLFDALVQTHQPATTDTYIMLLVHACIWSIGDQEATRHENLDELCKALMIKPPGNYFAVEPNIETQEWVPWSVKEASTPLPFIQDDATCAAVKLSATMADAGHSVILSGKGACGKSATLHQVTSLVSGTYQRLSVLSHETLVPGKAVTFCIDDLHLPTSPMCSEWLRQLVCHKKYYNQSTAFDTKTAVIATARADKLSKIAARLFHNCLVLKLPVSTNRQKVILKALLEGKMQEVPSHERLVSGIDGCVAVGIGMLEAVDMCFSEEVKGRYAFSFSTVVQAVAGLGLNTTSLVKLDDLYSLWNHEMHRTFEDRLTTEEDREWCHGTLMQLFESHCHKHPPLLHYGIDSIVEIEHGANPFESCAPNESLNTESIALCLRIARVLSMPGGALLLQGHSGSGRKMSLSVAAAYVQARLIHTPTVKGLCDAVSLAACEWQKSSLVIDLDSMSDLSEGNPVYEVVFMTLSLIGGNLPQSLFTPSFTTDLARLNSVHKSNKAVGLMETVREGCLSNLHLVVLCSPPVMNTVRKMMLPVVNTASHCYISHKGHDTLVDIAMVTLKENNPSKDKEELRVIARYAAQVHMGAVFVATEYNHDIVYSMTHITKLVESITQDEEDTLREKIEKRLRSVVQIEEMIELKKQRMQELSDLLPSLEGLADKNDNFSRMVQRDTQATTEAALRVSEQEERLNELQDGVVSAGDSIQQMLGKCTPAVTVALENIKSITKKDIDELLIIKSPLPKVAMVMESVLHVLELKPSWDTAKRLLADRIYDKLANYNIEANFEHVIAKCKSVINSSDFQPAVIRILNPVSAHLCQWVRAVHNVAEVYHRLIPKQQAFDKMKTAVEELQTSLLKSKQEHSALETAMTNLNADHKNTTKEYLNAQDKRLKAECVVERASVFTDAVSDRLEMWREEAMVMQQRVKDIKEGLLDMAATIYAPPLDRKGRVQLFRKLRENLALPTDDSWEWIPRTPNSEERQVWETNSLPSDIHSFQSASFMMASKLPPLLVDPHGCALLWVQNTHHDAIICKPINVDTINEAVRSGSVLIIEGVEEFTSQILSLLRDSETAAKGFKLLLTSLTPLYHPLVNTIDFSAHEGLGSCLTFGTTLLRDPQLAADLVQTLANISSQNAIKETLLEELLEIISGIEGSATDHPTLAVEIRTNKVAMDLADHDKKEGMNILKRLLLLREQYVPSAEVVSVLSEICEWCAEHGVRSPMFFSMEQFLILGGDKPDMLPLFCAGLSRMKRAAFVLQHSMRGAVQECTLSAEEMRFIQRPVVSKNLDKALDAINRALPASRVPEIVRICDQHFNTIEEAGSWVMESSPLEGFQKLLIMSALSPSLLYGAVEQLYPIVRANPIPTVLTHALPKVPIIVPADVDGIHPTRMIQKLGMQANQLEGLSIAVASEQHKEIYQKLQCAMHLGTWFLLLDCEHAPDLLTALLNELLQSDVDNGFLMWIHAPLTIIPPSFVAASLKCAFDKPTTVQGSLVSSFETRPLTDSRELQSATNKLCMVHSLLSGLASIKEWGSSHLHMAFDTLVLMSPTINDYVSIMSSVFSSTETFPWLVERIARTIVAVDSREPVEDTAEDMLQGLVPLVSFVQPSDNRSVVSHNAHDTPILEIQKMHPDTSLPLEAATHTLPHPMLKCLLSEVAAYNKLTSLVLADFKCPDSVTREHFEHGRVPEEWVKRSYPTELALGAWLLDLKYKLRWFHEWVHQGPPPAYWLSAFMRPKEFLTTVVLIASLEKDLCVQRVEMSLLVLEETEGENIDGYPDDGFYIYGLSLASGRWEGGAVVADSEAYAPFPAVHLRPGIAQFVRSYNSPVFRTASYQGAVDYTLPLPCANSSDALACGVCLVLT